MSHASDSAEQRGAEPAILRALEVAEGVRLAPQTLALEGGARVDIDGVAEDGSVLVEVFAHQGVLRGGQIGKVAKDALKLMTLRRSHPGARVVLAFGDPSAAASVMGKSWLAEALRTWEVEVFVASLDEELRRNLQAAQLRQTMVNPPASELLQP